MKNDTVISLPERAELETKSVLEQLITEGARKMLQAAIENEVQEYLLTYRGRRTDDGQALVVRNGHLPERDLVTGVGPSKSVSRAFGTGTARSSAAPFYPNTCAVSPASMR